MSTLDRTVAQTIINADKVSLKRIAWAFGCSKKGSEEERQLEGLLLSRARVELPERPRMRQLLAQLRTLRDRGRVTDQEMTQLVHDMLDILEGAA